MADPHVPPPVFPAPDAEAPGGAPGKRLPAAALRALEEAAARRAVIDATALAASQVPEDGGPKGLEPTRFGDWERKGVAVDF
jgi:hypothetical protein